MAHLYWRILEDSVTPQGALAIAEISMAATFGGSNQCFGGTAFASSVYSPDYDADKAFDGDPLTFWSSSGDSLGVSIGYQFPAPVDVLELVILPRPDERANTQGLQNFSLQYSDDGITYITLGTWKAATWEAGVSQTFDISDIANVVAAASSIENLTVSSDSIVSVSLTSIEALTELVSTANVFVAATLIEVLTPVYRPTVSAGGWVTVIS